MTGDSWVLDNVLVERRVVPGEDGSAFTETRTSSVVIDGGMIVEVREAGGPRDTAQVVDGQGLLLMPSLRDTHIHLDKTFFGGPWRAPTTDRPWPARLKEEERLLPEMSDQIPVRSNAILDLLVSNGTTDIVAHCNVDHVIGTRNVERLLEVLRSRDDVGWELTAFPQHGMQQGRIKPLLAQAMKAGATMVGGLDPGMVDRDVNGVLEDIFGLAVEHDAKVDFHLHDGGSLGLFELSRIVDFTIDAGWQGRVSLSNANALGNVDTAVARAAAERLAAARIGVGTTMAVGGPVIPVGLLDEVGVEVSLGSDSITDILTPFGQGDILEQVWMLAQRFGWCDEWSLAQALHFGTGPKGRWSADRTRRWPEAGVPADFMLVPATCSAEAVARRVSRQAVYRDGREVFSRLSRPR